MDAIIKNQSQFIDKIISYLEKEHEATNFDIEPQLLEGGLKLTFDFKDEDKFDNLDPVILITRKGASIGSEYHDYFAEPIYWENMGESIEEKSNPMKTFDELIKKIDHFLEDSILSITDRIQKAQKNLADTVQEKRKQQLLELLEEIMFRDEEFQRTEEQIESNVRTIEKLIDKILDNKEDYIHDQIVREKEFINFIYSTVKFLWAVGFTVNDKELEEKYLNIIYGLHNDDEFYSKLTDEEINTFITDYNKMYN